jgi:hypothetical protein
MAASNAVHYAGPCGWRVNKRTVRIIFAGFAACCSGERARKIAERGEHTYDAAAVTCAKCLNRIERTRAYVAEGREVQP